MGSLSMGGLPNDYENFVTLKNQCRITVLLLFFVLKVRPMEDCLLHYVDTVCTFEKPTQK